LSQIKKEGNNPSKKPDPAGPKTRHKTQTTKMEYAPRLDESRVKGGWSIQTLVAFACICCAVGFFLSAAFSQDLNRLLSLQKSNPATLTFHDEKDEGYAGDETCEAVRVESGPRTVTQQFNSLSVLDRECVSAGTKLLARCFPKAAGFAKAVMDDMTDGGLNTLDSGFGGVEIQPQLASSSYYSESYRDFCLR